MRAILSQCDCNTQENHLLSFKNKVPGSFISHMGPTFHKETSKAATSFTTLGHMVKSSSTSEGHKSLKVEVIYADRYCVTCNFLDLVYSTEVIRKVDLECSEVSTADRHPIQSTVQTVCCQQLSAFL